VGLTTEPLAKLILNGFEAKVFLEKLLPRMGTTQRFLLKVKIKVKMKLIQSIINDELLNN
jgi:hypothetical protein